MPSNNTYIVNDQPAKIDMLADIGKTVSTLLTIGV
jgi:hypothetical protein